MLLRPNSLFIFTMHEENNFEDFLSREEAIPAAEQQGQQLWAA